VKKTIKIFNVSLDNDFLSGDSDDVFFKDFRYLSADQKKALAVFVEAASNGKALPGKNKESWLDDTLREIPDTAQYKHANYWHYHSGPSFGTSTSYSLTHNLDRNLFGLTSSEVIHYIKGNDEIVIVGFSPNHTPFPKSDVGVNPMFPECDSGADDEQS